MDKPIIAALHGYALGAGCGLALGSDLVAAADRARVGYPELKAGLTTSTVTAQAVHLMGQRVAFALRTLCENMPPERRYQLGLFNRVVRDDGLMDAAMAMAERRAGWNKEFLWQTKLYRAAWLEAERALEMPRAVAVTMGRIPGWRRRAGLPSAGGSIRVEKALRSGRVPDRSNAQQWPQLWPCGGREPRRGTVRHRDAPNATFRVARTAPLRDCTTWHAAGPRL